FRKLRPILMHFFCIQDGCWLHKRVEQELKTSLHVSSVRSDAAKKRWLCKTSKADSKANAKADSKGCPKGYANGKQNLLQSPSQSKVIVSDSALSPAGACAPIEKRMRIPTVEEFVAYGATK